MDVYQCVEHFEDEIALRILIDSVFKDEDTYGGFPLPGSSDGGNQALVYDEFGIWLLHQSPVGDQSTGDEIRFFPFDVVSSCRLVQGEGAEEVIAEGESELEQRAHAVLDTTTLELTIAETPFRFAGRAISQVVGDEHYYAEVLSALFGIVRHCASYGVPVEVRSSVHEPVVASAGAPS